MDSLMSLSRDMAERQLGLESDEVEGPRRRRIRQKWNGSNLNVKEMHWYAPRSRRRRAARRLYTLDMTLKLFILNAKRRGKYRGIRASSLCLYYLKIHKAPAQREQLNRGSLSPE